MNERIESANSGSLGTARGGILRTQGSPGAPVSSEGPAGAQPEVYAFRDFRAYLATWFQWKKQVQSHYSGAIFAKKAGFNSHTLLGMVIRGQRNLSATSIRSFCRALGLKANEATYFEKLVLFNQAQNPEDQAYYGEQLEQAARGKSKTALLQLEVSVARESLQAVLSRVQAFREQLESEFGAASSDPVTVSMTVSARPTTEDAAEVLPN